ncbi:MAG: nucleoid-associated protein [Chitinophagales bacterium]
MINLSQANLENLVVHKVGNKLREEGIVISEELYKFENEAVRDSLFSYFAKSVESEEFYKFNHAEDLNLNEIYTYAKNIFEDELRLYDQSISILKHLYEQASHPKIKEGELFVAYLTDCLIDDELVDAIGIFKAEKKDRYLTLQESNQQKGLEIEINEGTNLRKLDKACMIFNTYKDEGYRLVVVDALSRSKSEAQYWKNDFLGTVQIQDDSFHTANYLHLCKDFCEEVFAEVHQEDPKDQVAFLNKSLDYFSKNEAFDLDDFANEVIEEPERIKEFKAFKQSFDEEKGIKSGSTDFGISQQAVKNMKRKFKNFIRLDTGIDIKLNSETSHEFVERGFDTEKGMAFYKVYFNQE